MSGLYLPSTLSSMDTACEMLPSVGMRAAPPDPTTTEPERVPAADAPTDDDMTSDETSGWTEGWDGMGGGAGRRPRMVVKEQWSAVEL